MIRKSVSIAMVVAFLATASAFAQSPPDFSGKWRLDAGRSASSGGRRGAGTGGGGGQGGGLGLGPSAETIAISQDATSLKIEEQWAGRPSARRVYALDGKKVSNSLAGGSATSFSTWQGDRLVTKLVISARGGSRELEETRFLDADGQLVVETVMPGQGNSRRSVYSR